MGSKDSWTGDWAGMYSIMGDPRSRTGIYWTYNEVPIIYKSSFQNCKATQCDRSKEILELLNQCLDDIRICEDSIIAQSSTEAETWSLAEGCKLGKHLVHLCQELGIVFPNPMVVCTDSTGAIGFARNNGGTSRMKHIDIREAWVQQLREKKELEIKHIPGTENPADFFTKILPRPATLAAMNRMMGEWKPDAEDKTMGKECTIQGGVVDELECDLDPKVDAHAERTRKAGGTQGSKGMELE